MFDVFVPVEQAPEPLRLDKPLVDNRDRPLQRDDPLAGVWFGYRPVRGVELGLEVAPDRTEVGVVGAVRVAAMESSASDGLAACSS